MLTCRCCRDIKKCRKILQRAVQSASDNPEMVIQALLSFEREEGQCFPAQVAPNIFERTQLNPYWFTCDGKGLVARARLLLFDCTVLSLGTLEDWDAAFSRCRVQLLRVNERRQKVIVRSVLLAWHFLLRVPPSYSFIFILSWSRWFELGLGTIIFITIMIHYWYHVLTLVLRRTPLHIEALSYGIWCLPDTLILLAQAFVSL